jgi:hypothetical protein
MLTSNRYNGASANIGRYIPSSTTMGYNVGGTSVAGTHLTYETGKWYIFHSKVVTESGNTTISLSYIKEGVYYPGTPVTNNSFNYPLRDLYVGSYPAGGHGHDAEWAEFRAYDGNMDSTQSNSKLNELATKWGL